MGCNNRTVSRRYRLRVARDLSSQAAAPSPYRSSTRSPAMRRLHLTAVSLATVSLATVVVAACAGGSATTVIATAPAAPLATTTPSTTVATRTTVADTTTTSSATPATTTSVAAPTAPGGAEPGASPGATTPYPPYAATTAVAVARPAAGSDPFAAFDQSLTSSLFQRGALTVSVAVAKDGRLVHAQAFGSTDPFRGSPAGVGDRYRIASISKTLLATATMKLIHDGRLTLDAPALGGLAAMLGVTLGDPAMATITLRQLLSHTSGFPEYQRTFFGGIAASCRDAALRGLGRGLLGPPGTVYRYSNLNYCLLGLLVEQATGRSYEQVVNEELLSPLGISDMRVAGTYDTRLGDVVHPTTQGRRFMEALGAAGNWIGTATDLVRVVDSLDPAKPGRHTLPAEVLAQMTLKAPVAYPHADSWYGLGLIVWDNGAAWGHTGTVENARSMVFHRADGITWAVLLNGGSPAEGEDLRRYVDKALATVTQWPA